MYFRFVQSIKLFFLKRVLKNIKLIVCDVDGVLTNSLLIYSDKGEVTRCFNVKDGLAIKLLNNIKIEVAIISGGKGNSINSRFLDLGVKEIHTEITNKREILLDIQKRLAIPIYQTLFIGDDINDLIIKDIVRLIFTPIDGNFKLKKEADFILRAKGGEGALREVVDIIIKNKRMKNEWIGTN